MPKSSMLWILVAGVFAAFMGALETGDWRWWAAALAGFLFLIRDKLSLKPVKKAFLAVKKRLKKKRSNPPPAKEPKRPKVKKNHLVVKYSKDLERRRAARVEPAEEAEILDSVAYEAQEAPKPRRLPGRSETRTIGRNIL